MLIGETVNRIATSLGVAAVTALLLLVPAAMAQASPVQVVYSTQGSFNDEAFKKFNFLVFGSGSNSLTITFSGVTNVPLLVDTTGETILESSLGTVGVRARGTLPSYLSETTLDIKVIQSSPFGLVDVIITAQLVWHAGTLGIALSPNGLAFDSPDGLFSIKYDLASLDPSV